MKSLMTFVGILAFNLPNIAMSSDFSCPVNANVSNFTCSGTVKVKTLAELNAYVNNLGVVAKKPTIAKNLQIDFNPDLTSDLVISTPCLIRIPSNVVMTSTGNICLNGTKGIVIDENFKFTGKNLNLESKEEVIINKNSVIKAQDIKLLSIGLGDASKTYIRDRANIEAANLSIESFDKGFIGKNSIVKLTGTLGIYSLGDDEASVREGARIEAAKIEISSTEETRVAKLTTLVASEIILNGIKCTINKTAVITADDRLGNCFLTSTTNKAKFSINKNQGTNPLTVNFNASSIIDAKGFVWSFGDGETLNSLTPNVTHIYNRVGSFTATLKYATKDNYKGLKSAGAIQIDVKEAPISNPVVLVPPRGNLKYQTDGTFVYLRGYIRKGTHDIANAYYVIDDNQADKIQIPNFYQNSLTSVEMNTYGRHKVTMNVIDVQGLTHSKSMNVYTDETESDVYPYMRLDVDQSGARTMFFDLSWSFNPVAGETLENFKVDFGDGQSAVLTDSAFITHTYAQAGTYLVRGTGSVDGNEDFDEYEIEVTDEITPIMNPVAGFEYQIHDYAGNVMFTNDRSGTPNGEIISYIWDFGDGTTGYGKDASNFYAPGDYLVTLTVVDTAGLRSSQTQKITIVAEGDDIASMLDCWSDRNKHLGCEVVAFDKFNEIVRVKLDWGDGSNESLTIPDQPTMGFSIREHLYQNTGTYLVKLIIDTERGQSKVLNYEHHVSVEPINNPVAIMNCWTTSNAISCDSFSSYSVGKNIIETSWDFGDGIIKNGDFVQHYYNGFGHYEVKMIIVDSDGKTAETTQVISIIETAPIALGSCVLKKQILECDASDSYSSSNHTISEYRWVITNEEDKIGKEISFEFVSAGHKEVRLFVKTNSVISEKHIGNYEVINLPPIAFFTCDSAKQSKLKCSAKNAEDDNRITSYEWKVNDEIIGNEDTFETTISSDGMYRVSLTVTDNMGIQSNDVSEILLTPSSVWNISTAIIENVLIENRPFYPLDGNVEFKVLNGKLGYELIANRILVNDEEINSDLLSYDMYNNSIKIRAKWKDGANVINFEIKDEYNKDVVSEVVIYNGKKDVEFESLVQEEGLSFNVSFFIEGMNDLELKLKDIESGYVLKNVPECMTFLLKMNSDNKSFHGILFPEQMHVDVKLAAPLDVVPVDNLNFSAGADGWMLEDSMYHVSGNVLNLNVGDNGTALLKKTLYAKENTGSVSFDFKITSLFKDDYYYVIIKNRTTGDISEEFLSTEHFSLNDSDSMRDSSLFKITKSVKVNSPDDIVDIELRLFSRHAAEDDSVVFNKIINLFFSTAVADSKKVISSETYGVLRKTGRQIISADLMNNNDMSLALISVGRMPIYYDNDLRKTVMPFPTYYVSEDNLYLAPDVSRPSNLIKFKMDVSGFDNLSPYRIRLLMYDSKSDHTIPFSFATALERSIIKNNRSISGEFRIMDMYNNAVDIPKELTLVLEIENFDGTKNSYRVENKVDLRPKNKKPKYNLQGQTFKTLVSMTANGYYRDEQRYGHRDSDGDLQRGGDDWIRPELIEQASTLVYGDPAGATIGDLSYMNGGSLIGHDSHGLGLSVDAAFSGYVEKPFVTRRSTAKKIINMLNKDVYLRNTELMYVTYSINSDFDNEISQTCLKNGRMANNVIKFWNKHDGHYHLELAPTVLDYGNYESSPFYISNEGPPRRYISKISKDLNTMQFKNMINNEVLNSDHYSVFVKLYNENDEKWVKLDAAATKIDFFINAKVKNSLFDIKIVFQGTDNQRCNTEIIKADLTVTEKNYSCIEEEEFGEFERVEIIPGFINSMFIGEQTLRNSPDLKDKISWNATWGTESLKPVNKSAICGNSTISSLSAFYNIKIKNSKLDTFGFSIGDSEIYDTEMHNTFEEVERSPSGVKNSIIRNSKFLKSFFIINSDISDSFFQDAHVYDSNISTDSSIVRSGIYGSALGGINYVSKSNVEESEIASNKFANSSATLTSIIGRDIVGSNFINSYIGSNYPNITGSNFTNSIIQGSPSSIVSGSFNNNFIYFSLTSWSGGFKSSTACDIYPAPPLPPDSTETYRIDKYCHGYAGYEGFQPYYVKVGIWVKDSVLGRVD